MESQATLPYGGDMTAAMKAQDRDAIRQIMAARPKPMSPEPQPEKGSGYTGAASSAPQEAQLPLAPKKPKYGVLADGVIPTVGMAVSIQDPSAWLRSPTVAMGRITYLDMDDPEIRIELLEEYLDVATEKGFKFAVHYDKEIWMKGKFLRKVDEQVFEEQVAASRAKVEQQEQYDCSPEFLSKLEAGTSEFEPTWPGGSWSANAAEDKYGLRPGMCFRYVGSTKPGSRDYVHGKVLEINHVYLGDPNYVWPNTDGPIAIIVKWGDEKTYIARPTGKLAGHFGSTVRSFMTQFKHMS